MDKHIDLGEQRRYFGRYGTAQAEEAKTAAAGGEAYGPDDEEEVEVERRPRDDDVEGADIIGMAE